MPLYFAGTAIGVFVGYLTAFRVLMVWCYDNTQILFVAIMHVSVTASLLILHPLGISGANLLVFSFAFAAAVWVVVAVIASRGRWHLERRPFAAPGGQRRPGTER
jgi:uncharacterized protein